MEIESGRMVLVPSTNTAASGTSPIATRAPTISHTIIEGLIFQQYSAKLVTFNSVSVVGIEVSSAEPRNAAAVECPTSKNITPRGKSKFMLSPPCGRKISTCAEFYSAELRPQIVSVGGGVAVFRNGSHSLPSISKPPDRVKATRFYSLKMRLPRIVALLCSSSFP
jgi:hypothetical protein